MPQMMPMNWILLFMYFILVFWIFNALNYFIYFPTISNTKKMMFKTKNFSNNWKW